MATKKISLRELKVLIKKQIQKEGLNLEGKGEPAEWRENAKNDVFITMPDGTEQEFYYYDEYLAGRYGTLEYRSEDGKWMAEFRAWSATGNPDNPEYELEELISLEQIGGKGTINENDEGQGNLSYEDLDDLLEDKMENEKLSVSKYMKKWFDGLYENISWTLGCIGDGESYLEELAQEVSKGNYLKEDYERCKNDLDNEKQNLHEIISDLDALDLLDKIGDIWGNEWQKGEGYLGKMYLKANSIRQKIKKEVEYAKR